jgi:signal transduction histidine kinase/ActR/RegA family two-component response regulator
MSDERERTSHESAWELRDAFDAVMRVVPAPVWITETRSCDVVRANPAAHAAMRTPEGTNASASMSDAGSRPFHEVDEKGGPVAAEDLPLQKAARTGRAVQAATLTFEFRDGSVRHLAGNASPLFAPDGTVRGAVAAFVDVTERRRAEEALRLELARRDEFLATLSHELRNPVGAISNAIALLNGIGPADPPGRSARAIITRQIAHLSRLVNDLLDVSRLAHGKLAVAKRPTALAPVLRAALDALAPCLAARGQLLEVSVPDEPLFAEADEVRLAQIVTNLVSNGSRYSREGAPVRVTLRREGDEAVLEVADEGVGIRPELLPRIFDLFVQGEPPVDAESGMGLGLHLASRLAAKHGGRIEAASDGPGRGSVFTLRLPLTRERPAAAPAGPSAGARAARRVLIVDDHVDSAEGLRGILEMEGHEVLCEENGCAGLAQAARFAPDVVILDIGLPEMDGYQIARQLRALPQTRSSFLIALTGYGHEEDRRRAVEAGFDVHRLKPVAIDELLALVAAARDGGLTSNRRADETR